MDDPSTTQDVDVLIMGAGMSGLCMAVELKRTGQHNFVVLEKSPGLGGTWWDNRYPGAHVDVPAPLYSFSFAPNPRWTQRFASAPEIHRYIQQTAQQHGVMQHLRLGVQITAAVFEESTARWRISTADGQQYRARYFVCSTGPLSSARWPDIDGLNSFQGRLLHTARWDPGEPLRGLRAGVIGTGSTAAQLVPPLAAQADSLVVFQRTANWVLPRMDRRYNALDRALTQVPGYQAAVRHFWYGLLEMGRRGFEDGTLARRSMLRAAAAHRSRQVADARLREQLTPRYPLGCKRIIYSNDYFPALTQTNVTLETASIAHVSPRGVVMQDGREHPLDLLVCATGFDVQHALTAVPITGRDGLRLQDCWAEGPQAYLGLTTAGFPNLFLMLGPNTATGHTSTLLYIEPGVRWAVHAMQEVQRRGAAWLDVKPAVMESFNTGLQDRLAGAVWSQCRSWYRADSGRNIAIWPGYTREYVSAVANQSFDDFEFGQARSFLDSAAVHTRSER
jgi:cation diffusion facilitator CzcD-associated flavoprotein CzcO